MKKIYLIALVVLGISADSFAQVSATASATAQIVAPIAISVTENLNFGLIATDGTAGTASVDHSNTRTKTGGTILVPSTTAKAAVFGVVGEASKTYSITLPSTAIAMTGTTTGLTVSNFLADLGAVGTLSGSGVGTIIVSARLNVPVGAIASGTYSNTSGFVVTVNYN